MSRAGESLKAREIDAVGGAGEAGRKAGEEAAKAAGLSSPLVALAGELGSRAEDAVKSFLTPTP